MFDHCITPILHNSNPIYIDNCENVINFDTRFLDVNTLVEMSNYCFDLYKFRLGAEAGINYQIGTLEYGTIYKSLIELLVSYKPINFSFSISSVNPSLHFIIRLPENISVFVETFIDNTDINNTYMQVVNDDTPILQVNGLFDECLGNLENTLAEVFPTIKKVFVKL